MSTSLPLQSPPASLCILRLSAIGDVSHMIPVVRTLQHVWPNTRITWVIGKVEAALLQGMEGIEFVVYDKRSGLAGIRALKSRFAGREFDVLLNMQAALRSNLVSRVIPAKIRLGFDKARGRDWQWLFTNEQISGPHRVHVLDGFFQFLEALGIRERVLRWDIPVRSEDQAFANQIVSDQPLLLINPSSSVRLNNYRNWSAENYATLCDHAAEQCGMQVAVTGGPAANEKDLAAKIIANCRTATPLDLTGKTSLKQLLAIIDRAEAMIAPDTGPMHLAVSRGKPVIGLFATSNPDRSGPYINRSFLVNHYPDALLADTGKSVAQAKWGQRVRNPEAMLLIRCEEVIDQLDNIMAISRAR